MSWATDTESESEPPPAGVESVDDAVPDSGSVPGDEVRAVSWLWLVTCGLLAALPLVGVVVGLWRLDWAPQGDNATLAWRAWNVFSTRPPLTGPYTQASGGSGDVYGLGPLQFWVMAAPTRLWPELGPVLAAALLGMASVTAGIVAVGRLAGRGVAVVVAAGGLVATVTAGQAITDPVWNPFASLLPFAGLLLVSWAVAAGELRWWPVAVFLGSFCAQTHLTYAVPALLVVVVAPVVGYTVVRATEHRPPVRPAVVGALVAVAAWSGPVWQQLTGETGNLSMLGRTVSGGQDEVVGTGRALRMLAYGITGRPPAWLDGPTRDSAERTQGVSASSPWLAVVVVLLLLLALVAALRRQDRITAGVDVVALAACTGFVLGIRGASGPHVELTLWYMLTALIPIGMFTCLALGWSAWRLVIRDRVGARRRARGMAPPIAIGALAVCSLLITVWMGDWGPHSWDSHPTGWPHTRAVSRDVLGLIDTADLTPGRLAVGIDSLGPGSQSVRRGVAYGLATRGWTPTMSEHDLKMLDDDRFRAEPDDRRLVMVDQPAPASGDLLGEVHDPMTGRDMSLYIVRP